MKDPFGSRILDAATRLLVPFMLLYGTYVVLHGHDAPGGGFQGGVIYAVAFILLRLVGGTVIPFGLGGKTSALLATLGLLIFLSIGLLPLFFGGNFLDYGTIPLGQSEIQIRVLATLGIEIGIALTVSGTLLLIYETLIRGAQQE